MAAEPIAIPPPRRGEVWVAKLVPDPGADDGTRRRVLVIQNNRLNDDPSLPTVVIVPVMSKDHPRAVTAQIGESMWALLDGMHAISRWRFVEKIGAVEEPQMRIVNAGLCSILGV